MPPPGTAELRLDVTSDVTDEGTALLIAPVIKTPGGDDALPLCFIGTEGHGVVLADREQARSRQPEHSRFRLARLAAPVPRQLQQLALADELHDARADECLGYAAEPTPRARTPPMRGHCVR